ncbi:hypothetical protein HZH66_010853 [Vespula vulgaris]|uniref:Uncharacterized protein n=1 Tax=Vespula vulgaris TaxID=7454 RepID=A0A834JGL0_VESVU|nr:hypothetical protein HZH66_010853 [Vespula vulgaris]
MPPYLNRDRDQCGGNSLGNRLHTTTTSSNDTDTTSYPPQAFLVLHREGRRRLYREKQRERDRKIERKRERVGEETQFETSEFEYGRPQAETMGTSMDHTGCEQMVEQAGDMHSLGISTINPYMFECSFYDPRGNVRGSVIDKGTSNSVLVDRKERTRYPDEEEEVEDEEEIGASVVLQRSPRDFASSLTPA